VPVEHPVQASVKSETLRQAAGDGNDVEVGVSVVVSAKGDPGTIRRKAWKSLLPAGGTETLGEATGFWGNPNVAGVNENDTGFRNIRVTDHPGVDADGQGARVCCGSRGEYTACPESQAKTCQKAMVHHNLRIRSLYIDLV